MKEREKKQILEAGKAYSAFLNVVEPYISAWASRKENLEKAFNAEVRRHRKIVNELPENWEDLAKPQFIFGRIFGSPVNLRKFTKAHREELPDLVGDICQSFFENPWWYSIFTVMEDLGDDLFMIYDFVREEENLLLSESVTKFTREGKELFMSLLFQNPLCCQTYGIMNFYSGFQPFDFFYFASMVNPSIYENSGIESVLFLKPIPFYLLYRWSGMPSSGHDKELIIHCSSRMKSRDFDPQSVSSQYAREDAKQVTRWDLSPDDDFFHEVKLYWETDKKLVTLHALGRGRYSEAVENLKGIIEFPEEPRYEATVLMLIACQEILGKRFPGLEYEDSFEPETAPGDQAELDKLNAFLREISEHMNYGKKYDIDALAAKHDIGRESAHTLVEDLQKSAKKYAFPAKGGIDGFEPPPPAAKRRLNRRFVDNDTFDFAVNASTRKLFKAIKPRYEFLTEGDKELSLEELPLFLEDTYFDLWESKNQVTLLYTLYLLKVNGGSFLSVRDYAAEVLNSFGQVLLSDYSDENREIFIDFYGVFCFHILYTFGLVDTDRELQKKDLEKPKFSIKASEFFRQWIQWKQLT